MIGSWIGFGVCTAIALGVTYLTYIGCRQDYINHWGRVASTGFAVLGFVISFGLTNSLAYAISHDKEWVTYDLTALSVDSQVSGSFFLGSGTIDEDAVFYFYTRDDNGRVHMAYTPASNADLIETNGDPYARCYTSFANYFGKEQVEGTPSTDYEFSSCDFYVPAGSIKSDFNTTLPGGNS